MAFAAASTTMKFLCSYGGKILPRYPDGKLRYHGGETRVLSVDRSISFSDLIKKMTELYGAAVRLRCQLPSEDLDALISIQSDEDLVNIIEEYDRAASPLSALKVRAFLSPVKKPSPTTVTTPSSSSSSASSPKSSNSSPKSYISAASLPNSNRLPNAVAVEHFNNRAVKPPIYPLKFAAVVPKLPPCAYHACHGSMYLVHNGNYWQ